MKKSIIVGLVALIIVGVVSVVLFKQFRSTNTSKTQINSQENLSYGRYNPPKEVKSGEITLDLISPADGQTVDSASITISGKTAPAADVFVDDQEAKADKDGNFKVQIALDEGENQISITVNDSNGNYIEKDITINYEAGR